MLRPCKELAKRERGMEGKRGRKRKRKNKEKTKQNNT